MTDPTPELLERSQALLPIVRYTLRNAQFASGDFPPKLGHEGRRYELVGLFSLAWTGGEASSRQGFREAVLRKCAAIVAAHPYVAPTELLLAWHVDPYTLEHRFALYHDCARQNFGLRPLLLAR